MYNVSLIIECVFIVHYVYWVYVCVFCTLSSVQSVNMYCPYVNCFFFFLHCLSICKLLLFFLHCLSICKLLLFFCTVWSTVNAPVQFLFFLHCLSICKLFVVFFALSGARSQEFHSPRHLCCGDVTIKVIWFDLIMIYNNRPAGLGVVCLTSNVFKAF